jgi:type I restriction enzyme S subunit
MAATVSQSNQQINSIVVDPKRFDAHFVYYRMRLMREQLKSRAAGAATPILNKSAFSAISIDVPPLPIQRRIASILGAYDDVIEVNRRRIALLEEMAQHLFEEWFVRFRFPGHERHPMVKTPNGTLPKGWRSCPVSDVATVVGNSISPGSCPGQHFLHFSFPAFDSGQVPIEEAAEAILSNKFEFASPCVLIGKLNPRIPRIWNVPTDGPLPQIASTEFVPVRPTRGMTLSVLYSYLNSSGVRDKLRSLTQGTSTSHQRARPGDILAIPLSVPPDGLIAEADRHLAPAYELATGLRVANARLAGSRDLLLPSLVSGAVAVSVAERELETAA